MVRRTASPHSESGAPLAITATAFYIEHGYDRYDKDDASDSGLEFFGTLGPVLRINLGSSSDMFEHALEIGGGVGTRGAWMSFIQFSFDT